MARLVALLVFFPALAVAQTPPAPVPTPTPGPADQALPTLTPGERAGLAPLLPHGPVALVGMAGAPEIPAVLVAIEIHAPASQVAALIADPAGYPRFVPVLHNVTVTGRHDQSVSYDWTWQTAVLELHGTNVLDAFPPPARRPQQGWRFSAREIQGDLGQGRLMWRVLPEGDDRTLLTVAMRLDLHDANYMARQMSQAGRTVNRSVSLAIALLLALGTRREAERLAGTTVTVPTPSATPADPPAPLAWPEFDPLPLMPLFAHYDMVQLELAPGDRLVRILALGRSGAQHAAVASVITDPSSFGDALIPGARARIVDPTATDGVLFDWGVDIPLIGTSGRMRLRDVSHGDVVEVDGVTGALHTGRWRFEQRGTPWHESYVVASGEFDIGDSAWLIRSLVSGCPDLGMGLAAAAQVMVVRAIRARAMELEAAHAH